MGRGGGRGGTGDGDGAREVVVGLSVRSLLDLYLAATRPGGGRAAGRGEGAAEDEEVLVVPPVSVPGMVDVLEHHGLRPVPVDLPGPLPAEGAGATRWDVDLAAVAAAVTPRTAAILVVHPFGHAYGSDTLRGLRAAADAAGLALWEDCAQCYAGAATTAGDVRRAGYARVVLLVRAHQDRDGARGGAGRPLETGRGRGRG